VKCSDLDDAGRSKGCIQAGDFVIDTTARIATLRGEILPLTPDEFEVLVFLVSHPQRLITPHTVLSTNWTGQRLHQTEALKALLSLRRKLDALAPGKHYLRTEPWVVYRFNPDPSSPA